MSQYELAPNAVDDLLEIIRFSKKTWGIARAERYREELELAVQQMALAPTMGRQRGEIAEGVRSFPVAQHVAFYVQQKDKVIILRILHPRMDVDAAFKSG